MRAAAIAAPGVDVDGELFARLATRRGRPRARARAGQPSSATPTAKGALIETLLGGRASDATIAHRLVPRAAARVSAASRQLLSQAMDIVADQRGSIVATVTTAAPLNAGAVRALERGRSRSATARRSRLNAVIDPSIVGGLRVQIADDVIDGSVAARLTDLRQRLAG